MNHDERIEQMQQFSQFVWNGKQRGLSRREFLKRGLALGLSLPTISAVLVGCGVDSTDQSAAAGPTTAPTTTPPTPQPTATAQPTATPQPTATAQPTATPQPAQARFAVIGDYGLAGQAEADVAALVKSWDPDFIVTTGDNNYPMGEAATIDANIGQYYHDYMRHTGSEYGPEAPRNRFFPVLGNHDTDVASGEPYFNYFVLPGNERYYTMEWPPVRIYAVNSVPWIEPDGAHPESAQAAWLQQELAASPDTWNVVVFHHPPYTSDGRGANEWMRWPFQEWGADVVLSGHHHVYERLTVDGFTYLVNGLGGGARYAFAEIAAGSEVQFNTDHGAQLVEATEDRISFQFITRTGEVIDTFVLERSTAS
jgi:predicted phosphodiesterase